MSVVKHETRPAKPTRRSTKPASPPSKPARRPSSTTPAFVTLLVDELASSLAAAGIQRAKITSEPVGGGTKIHRISVVSPSFKTLSQAERQGIVWRIAEKALAPSDQIKISMILTLTPAELAQR